MQSSEIVEKVRFIRDWLNDEEIHDVSQIEAVLTRVCSLVIELAHNVKAIEDHFL